MQQQLVSVELRWLQLCAAVLGALQQRLQPLLSGPHQRLQQLPLLSAPLQHRQRLPQIPLLDQRRPPLQQELPHAAGHAGEGDHRRLQQLRRHQKSGEYVGLGVTLGCQTPAGQTQTQKTVMLSPVRQLGRTHHHAAGQTQTQRRHSAGASGSQRMRPLPLTLAAEESPWLTSPRQKTSLSGSFATAEQRE